MESIGNNAFYNCPVATAYIPTIAIAYIPKGGLTTVEITSGRSVAELAFNGCSTLRTLTISKSVTSFGKLCLGGCANLNNVYYEGTRAEWNAIEKYRGITVEAWDYGTGSYTIHCTGDGSVFLKETGF